MENYSVVIPSYTVGPESYKKIPEFCGLYGKKAVVIGGERAMEAAKEKMLKALEGSDMEITGFVWFGKECTFAAAKRLAADPAIQEADMQLAAEKRWIPVSWSAWKPRSLTRHFLPLRPTVRLLPLFPLFTMKTEVFANLCIS